MPSPAKDLYKWLFFFGGKTALVPVGARVVYSAGDQLFTGAAQVWNEDTVQRDDANLFSISSPTRLTIPITGWWIVGLDVEGSGGQTNHQVYVNHTFGITVRAGGAVTNYHDATGLWYFTAGDFIEGLVTLGGTHATVSSPPRSPCIWAVLVR